MRIEALRHALPGRPARTAEVIRSVGYTHKIGLPTHTSTILRAWYHLYRFPPFFDGLLPEGLQLEGLLRQRKIDRDDYFSQLAAVGKDLVGAISVEELS